MINTFLLENFFVYYYLIEASGREFITEDQKHDIFVKLAEIFCIDKASVEEYYEFTHTDWVSEVVDYTSYTLLARSIEFAGMNGQDIDVTDFDRINLAGKRMAMLAKDEIFKQSNILTVTNFVTMLRRSASSGNICAMGTMAFLEYFGIFVPQLCENAIARMRLCAKWNDLFGNLFGIMYDKDNTHEYHTRLYTILKRINMEYTFDYISERNGYTHDGSTDPISGILYTAVSMNMIQKDKYDRAYADMIFSDIIPLGNKKVIATGAAKEWNAPIPFNAKKGNKLTFDSSCISRMPVDRGEESMKIVKSLFASVCCPNHEHKPTLIVAGDKFVSEMYIKMVKDGFGEASVVELDATGLNPIDLSCSPENIFIRQIGIKKQLNTVFIIKNCENLRQELVDAVKDFVTYDKRKSFNIVNSSVTLDLSDMRFVFVAEDGGVHPNSIESVCDTIFAKRISSAEKPLVITAQIKSRARSFDLGEVEISPDCNDIVADIHVSKLGDVVDEVIKEIMFKKATVVTAEDIESACRAKNVDFGVPGFGFIYNNGGKYEKN